MVKLLIFILLFVSPLVVEGKRNVLDVCTLPSMFTCLLKGEADKPLRLASYDNTTNTTRDKLFEGIKDIACRGAGLHPKDTPGTYTLNVPNVDNETLNLTYGYSFKLPAFADGIGGFGAVCLCPVGFYCPPPTGNQTFIVPVPCQQGFDCGGERNVTASSYPLPCPSGYACSTPSQPQKCPLGTYCPEGSVDMELCDEGWFCNTSSTRYICPYGHYCPFSSTQPLQCGKWASCPEGSSQETLFMPIVGVCAMLALYLMVSSQLAFHTDDHTTLKQTVIPLLMALSLPVVQIFNNSNEYVPWTFITVYFAAWLVNSVVVIVKRRPSSRTSLKKALTNARVSSGGMSESSIANMQQSTQSGYEFTLRNVNFFTGRKTKRTQRLHDINLILKANSLVAIMGPSGCGKTTLLNTLCSRANYGQTEGDIAVDGQLNVISNIRRQMGFVPQDDTMHTGLTVMENIRAQYDLRAPVGLNRQEVFHGLMKTLGLGHIEHSVVGDVLNRGISGGQKKRVNIGMELVTNPLAIFLDEPTTGLDSKTTHSIISSLRDVTRNQGCTAAAVIHQPAWKSLQLFDEVVLLAKDGHLCYAGPVADVQSFFEESHGVVFPDDVNPADILLECISQEENGESPGLTCKTRLRRDFSKIWANSDMAAKLNKDIDGKLGMTESMVIERPRRIYRNFGHSLAVCYSRAMSQMQRETAAIITMLALIALVMLISWVSFGPGSPMGFFAFTFNLSYGTMMMCGLKAQKVFSAEIAMTLRETRSGLSPSILFWSKYASTFGEICLCAITWAGAYSLFCGCTGASSSLSTANLILAGLPLIHCTYSINIFFSLVLGNQGVLAAIMIAMFSGFFGGAAVKWPDVVSNPILHVISEILPVRWVFGYLVTAQAQSWFDQGKLPQALEPLFTHQGFDLEKTLHRNGTITWSCPMSRDTFFVEDFTLLWIVSIVWILAAWLLHWSQCKMALRPGR